MKVLCLCPTYGRRASLLENSIQLFLNQTYQDKTLLLFDDLGTLADTQASIPSTMLISTNKRCNSVGAKYNIMMEFAYNLYDAVVVWDDDDIMLPNYISSHVEVLHSHLWSKPSTIISAYHRPPAEEKADGRFHGSIAARTSTIKAVGGWIDTRRATFDQEMLQRLTKHSLPGDPCFRHPPQYVYRWQTSGGGHCSGLMGDSNWYELYQPDSAVPIPTLKPRLDEDTITTLHNLSIQYQ